MDRFKILNNFNFSMEYEYNSIILKLYSIWSAILSMRKKKKKLMKVPKFSSKQQQT